MDKKSIVDSIYSLTKAEPEHEKNSKNRIIEKIAQIEQLSKNLIRASSANDIIEREKIIIKELKNIEIALENAFMMKKTAEKIFSEEEYDKYEEWFYENIDAEWIWEHYKKASAVE